MENLSPKEFKEVIRSLHDFENPPAVMVFGEPGIGKSFAAKEIAEELGRAYMPLSLGRLEAYDIKGMPDLSKEFMEWKPPVIWEEIIKAGGNVLLHFDEFTLADEAVQGAVLDIIQMKKIDDKKLPDKTMIVISGNMGGDDGTFAKVITSALTGGRAIIFRMKKPTVREWVAYQKPSKLIENFLEANSSHLYRGPNTAEPFAPWSCPRSWSLLDSVIKKLKLEDAGSRRSLAMFARGVLSEDTVNHFLDYAENTVIDASKVASGDPAATRKFLEADNFRQSGIVKEIAKMEVKVRAKKREMLQAFLDMMVKNSLPKEMVALFAEELVKHDPETLVKLTVAGVPLDSWADKLAFELT
ncbi:MAG TPA: AAA family ATPase [Candidatus Goldiibacteriota bacterium]|nr:AAA family ATPase [Candidatus Goldiibacteriota bacterium]